MLSGKLKTETLDNDSLLSLFAESSWDIKMSHEPLESVTRIPKWQHIAAVYRRLRDLIPAASRRSLGFRSATTPVTKWGSPRGFAFPFTVSPAFSFYLNDHNRYVYICIQGTEAQISVKSYWGDRRSI